MMLYGIMCQMLPRVVDGPRPIRMHGPTFATAEARDAEMTTLRRENLPFNMQPVDLPDYSEPAPKVGDGTPDAGLAIGEHAFRAGWEAMRASLKSEANADFALRLDLLYAAWDAYDPPKHIKELS